MNDLEERLRADFEAATAEVDYAIDPDEVLRAGRVRRTRTMGRVAAFTAAAVALLGVSVYAAPPLIAQILDHQTLEVDSSFDWDKTHSEFDQLVVKLQDKDDVVTATAAGLRDGAVVTSKSWTVPDANTPMRVALGSRAVVAILPGKVEQFELMQGLSGSGGAHQWMPAFGVTVAAMQLESSKTHPEGLDWVWLDSTGAVRSFDGTLGATATLRGETYLLYVSHPSDMAGVVGRFGFPLSRMKDADLLDGAVAWGGTDAVSWQLGVLPAGAHDLHLKLSKADGDWVAVALSDGSVIVAAEVPGEPKQVVTGLSYVRADGSTVKLGR
jgi:hypothetical protein